MATSLETPCIAFDGDRRIASGTLARVAADSKPAVDRGGQVLIFEDATGEPIEVDFRGTADEVVARLGQADAARNGDSEAARGRGRPRLGVVAREVTLLPRHWEWLRRQPGGASVALRKLVDQARRTNGDQDRVRQSQEVAYRFMSAMAGDRPGFEEATRALFANNRPRFDQETASWPEDIRDHARKLAAPAFEPLAVA